MALEFPSSLDASVQEFRTESQNIRESIVKHSNSMPDLRIHVDKQINTLDLQGRYSPKILSQWATEARALKGQALNVLPEQQNNKGEFEKLVKMRTKIIKRLKKWHSIDEMMYDKQNPVLLTYESGSDKLPSTQLEQKHKIEALTQGKTDQSLNPFQLEDVQQDYDAAGMILSTSGHKWGREILGDMHELSKFADIEQQTLHPSSSQQMQHCYNDVTPAKENYSVIMMDDRIEMVLDQQTILIGDRPSSGPLESSPVTGLINLAEQDLRELPEKPDYPNSLVLFLQRNNRLTLIHSSFFDSMPDLIFLDLSDTRIRILPSSLFGLSKLKVLMLRNCASLEELPSEIGKLNNLEVLDLSGTELYSVPDEIKQLVRLKHVQLSLYGPDDESEYAHLPPKLISHGVLSALKTLETISIVVHPADYRWTEIAEDIMKDVGSLERLSSIQFYFPKVESFQYFIEMSPSWNEQRLRKFKFIVGRNVKRIVSRVPDEVESLFHQHYQCLRFVNGDEVSHVIKTVLRHATAFYLDHHVKIQSLSEFGISAFRELKFCVVRECPKIQVILDEIESEGAFPSLEYLGVYYLWELKHMWKSPLPAGSFQVLKYLIVNTCPKLKFILRKSKLQCLSNLEELVVENCARVEKIMEEDEKQVDDDSMVFPKLRKLVLRYLPNLVSLGSGLCPSKEIIITYACPKFMLNSALGTNKVKQRNFVVKQRNFVGSYVHDDAFVGILLYTCLIFILIVHFILFLRTIISSAQSFLR